MRRPLCLLAVSLSIAFTASSKATAAGFYNMPTNLQQCLGVGFGPGYHAPLILGSPLKAKTASQPLLRYGPLPPKRHGGFAQPSVLVEQAPTHAFTSQIVPSHEASHRHVTSQPVVAAPPVDPSPTFVAPANHPPEYEEVPAPILLPRGGA